MERSDKQRKPVAVKNLAELKRFIQPGVEFKTLSQKNHPDLVGLTRVVTTVQTVCFYSKIKDQPNSRFSTDNGGKGFRTDFAKADAYIFDGTTVKVKDLRNKDRGVIYEFEFYDGEQTMQEDTNMDRKMVNFIKEQYPPGTRIRLNSMEDPYAPVAPGTEGEVDFVDDIGTIHMKWDNGRALGIVPGEDSFSVLPPKLTTLKLYMPLTADFYERSEYGDMEPESTELDGRALRGYQAQITAALMKNRVPEETERGLMHWYHEADSVNTKVHSAVFTVEERTLELPASAEALRNAQKQIGADGWEGVVVLDYDGIIPQAAEFADLPAELDAFNDFAESVKDMPSREKQLPKLKALLEHFKVTDLAAAAGLAEHMPTVRIWSETFRSQARQKMRM